MIGGEYQSGAAMGMGLACAVIAACACFAGCAVPVAFPRTGRVLQTPGARFGGATATGLAPTTATESWMPEGKPSMTRTYRGLSPTEVHVSQDTSEIIASLLFSIELEPAIAPFGRCELGMPVGAARFGGELRCGTLDGELGHLELAVSSAVAVNLFAAPRGAAMLRGGIDMSLGGSRVVPVLDVYFGYVPWRRGVGYYDADREEWTAFSSVDGERGEYRLSIPLGISFREVERTARTSRSFMLAVIPELTLATRDLEPGAARVEQTFAIFIVFGTDLSIEWHRP